MPSKLYGALAAGRPMVFIGDPEGDAARIVRDGPGLVASPEAMPGAGRSRCGRCAAIRRASRGWAPPPGTPMTPAPETPASTPGPAACMPGPPSPGRRANCPSRWRRNERAARARRRIAGVDLARYAEPVHPRQPQRRLADRLAPRERARLPERPGPALALEGGCAALLRRPDRHGPGDQAARHRQVSVVPGARRPRLAGRRRVDRQSHHGGDRLRTSASARAPTCSPATTTGTTRGSASSASRSRSRTACGWRPKAMICPGSVLARMSVVGAGVVWRGTTLPAVVYTHGLRPDAPMRRSA